MLKNLDHLDHGEPTTEATAASALAWIGKGGKVSPGYFSAQGQTSCVILEINVLGRVSSGASRLRAIGLGHARTETLSHSSAPREVRALDALFILISILMLCLYNVLIKKFPNKFILFFLVNVFSYLGFLGIYFFRVFVLQHDLGALHELIVNYTYQNVPLYVLIAFSFLGYMIVSEKLLDGYDVSLVIPISQFGMLLASAGYIALGDPFKWSLILGLCVLCIGTFIISLAAIPPSSTETIFVRWTKIPKKLWLLTLVQAGFFILSATMTYLGTKETVRTEMIMSSLRRMHMGPVSFHSAFYFSLGQQFFSVTISTVYILARKRYRDELLIPIEKNLKYLLMVVASYFIATYAYLIAFTMTKDTTILLGLDNLSIPITLLFAFVILKEKLSSTKILGSALIVLGGVIAVL